MASGAPLQAERALGNAEAECLIFSSRAAMELALPAGLASALVTGAVVKRRV
jgi:hypothetical protein